jgi:hypothetical protein
MKTVLNFDKNPSIFQILLLDSQKDDVTVHETKKIDYSKVKKHLATGGAVFITSKNSQKQKIRKTNIEKYIQSRKNYGFKIQQTRNREKCTHFIS